MWEKVGSRWHQRSRKEFLCWKLFTLMRSHHIYISIRAMCVYCNAGQLAFNKKVFSGVSTSYFYCFNCSFCELFCDVWRTVGCSIWMGKDAIKFLFRFQLFMRKPYRQVYFLPALCHHKWIKCGIFSMWPVSTCNTKISVHKAELFLWRKSCTNLLMPTKSLLCFFTGRTFFFYGFIAAVCQACLISMCWKHQANLQWIC